MCLSHGKWSVVQSDGRVEASLEDWAPRERLQVAADAVARLH